MSDGKRQYRSPTRAAQARQTREDILDALMELLEDQPAEDITVREIAAVANISPATVYNHFPDREALIEGLNARIGSKMGMNEPPLPDQLEDMGAVVRLMFSQAELFPAEIRASALLRSDPPYTDRFTADRTDGILRLVEEGLPDLDEQGWSAITGLIRLIGSMQAWLRFREESGITGERSGSIVAWAIDTLVDAARREGVPVEVLDPVVPESVTDPPTPPEESR